MSYVISHIIINKKSMRGPIDYIVVGFEGNKFNGAALEALQVAMDKGTIDVLDLALIVKDDQGELDVVEIASVEDPIVKEIAAKKGSGETLITDEDIEEIGEILENETAAGLLIIEQLWAIDLKKALIEANGKLIAEGRIHPEAQKELDA